MSPATLIEVSQMLSKLHDTSYINIRATPSARNDKKALAVTSFCYPERSEGSRNCFAEPVLSEILRFAQNDRGSEGLPQNDKRKLGVRMTESEGFAMTDRMGFLPLNEHRHDHMDIVVHANRTNDAGA